MSLYTHHLQIATQLVEAYEGQLPLHHYLKTFFSAHKKYGARDRKRITSFCYNFYRLGKALPSIPKEQKIVLANYLVNQTPENIVDDTTVPFENGAGLPLRQKMDETEMEFLIKQVFPYGQLLSNGIEEGSFSSSMLQQPDVFLRIRPGKREAVEKKLDDTGWTYSLEDKHAVRLPPGTPVEKSLQINQEIVVQDLNSQKVGTKIKEIFSGYRFVPNEVWDCCAASGGKSIMMHDLFPGVRITVSDIRSTIIDNLKKRFAEAGIKNYQYFVTDLSMATAPLSSSISNFQFIIADVPCTGSGTWARTPEQLYFFEESQVDQYAKRQFSITRNVVKQLTPGGWLVYITCSIFKKENEEVVNRLLEVAPLALVYQQLLDGTQERADSMFVAILRLHQS